MSGPGPQVVERGDSVRPYRARLAPVAQAVELCGIGHAIVVLRCHDVDVARRVVATNAPHATPVWLRWVLDEYDNPDAGGSWERELRGTAGATPAVLFTARPLPTYGVDTDERNRP